MSIDSGSIRVLIVVGSETALDRASYEVVFDHTDCWLTVDDSTLSTVICDVDPHVIISLGSVAPGSHLWRMPLWRRQSWLNLPDVFVAPDAVKMSALSLLASATGESHFDDVPLVTVIPLGRTSSEVIHATRAVVAGQVYDNMEVLVANNIWSDVRDQFVGQPIAMTIRSTATSSEFTPMAKVMLGLSWGRGEWLWPIGVNGVEADADLLGRLVSASRTSKTTSSLIACDADDRGTALNYLEGDASNVVRHVLISRRALIGWRGVAMGPPLTSVAGVLAACLADSNSLLVPMSDKLSLDSGSCREEADGIRQLLLQAPIALARRQLGIVTN